MRVLDACHADYCPLSSHIIQWIAHTVHLLHLLQLLDFHADVNLVFENAKTYNPPGSPVYRMASELKGIFETQFLKLLDQLEAELIQKEERIDLLAL